MPEVKTKLTAASVDDFLEAIENDQVRDDCRTIAGIMEKAAKAPPRMWGTSIVGFGDYRYKSARTGREGDWFVVGFAPRKGTLALYLLSGLHKHDALLHKLGKHKTGKGCLYIKTLADVDAGVLKKLVEAAAEI